VKAISGKELCKIVQHRGWQLLRVTGSHHIYGKPGSIVRLSIPVHANKPLKSGLLNHLLKSAKIDRDAI